MLEQLACSIEKENKIFSRKFLEEMRITYVLFCVIASFTNSCLECYIYWKNKKATAVYQNRCFIMLEAFSMKLV